MDDACLILARMAARFGLTAREVQVLELMCAGRHLDEIALDLHIVPSTVQDHINSMLNRTDSRNRSELIARMLGWEARGDSA